MTTPNIHFDLKAWRTAQNLTMNELALMFGVSKPQIWRLEKQGTVPKIYLWACKALANERKVSHGQ